MPSVAAATVGAGLIGAGASAYGANKAANAQTKAGRAAIAAQREMFDVANQNLQPYISTGSGAANQLANLEGFGPGGTSGIQSTLESLPGYQFANYQGLKSTQNSATERGLGLSGAAIKGAANYSTGLANQYYNNLLSGIQATENTGEAAAGSLAGAATETGAGIAGSERGIGNAQGGADIATANAIGSGASSVPNGLVLQNLLSRNTQSNGGGTQGIYDAVAADNGLPWSDENLKENIVPLGHENGHPIYEFNYIWAPKKFIGVMAQDILRVLPDAVRKIGNYLAVDYDKIGVKFREA